MLVLRSPEKGEPKVTTARIFLGQRCASCRANIPPRLQPTSRTLRLPLNLVEPFPEKVERIGLGAQIDAEQPGMQSPAGAGEGAAKVHRRAVGGEEAGDNQCGRTVLRAARTERPKAREQAWQMPGDFGNPSPARRCKIVRMNRAPLSRGRAARECVPTSCAEDEVFPLPEQ